MILKYDGFDDNWERTDTEKVAAGLVDDQKDHEEGGFDETDSEDEDTWCKEQTYRFGHRKFVVKKNTDYAYCGRAVAMTSEAEAREGYFTLQEQLKTHFGQEYRARNIEWLGKQGGQGPADPTRRGHGE